VTRILYVEPEATSEAVRRRLARLESGAVAVVLPEGWGELRQFARLRLLQRQAQARGQALALVTRDGTTRRLAQELGIPVFGSQAAVEGRTWQMDTPLPRVDPRNPAAGLPEPPPWRRPDGQPKDALLAEAGRPSLHRARQRRIQAEQRYRQPAPGWQRLAVYGGVGTAVLLFLAAFLYVVLPAATVTVVPGQRLLEVPVELVADPALEVPDYPVGRIPARLVETVVEASGSILPTGGQQQGVERAQGFVTFTNQTNLTVRIPKGTILSSSTGVRVDFRTTEDAEIPGPVGTRVDVPIEAVEPGPLGNVRANTITTIPGALRTQVQVTNPEPTTGGAAAVVPVVTQADQERLLAQVHAAIQDRAASELARQLRGDEWIPPESIQTFVVAQAFSAFVGEPAEELRLDLRVLVQGTAIPQRYIQEAALNALEDAVPARAKLVADSIQVAIQPGVQVENRSVAFTAQSRGHYVIPMDTREMRAAVAGKPPEEAARILQERWLLAAPPEFYLDPGWFGTLPRIPNRIQVRVDYREAVQEVSP